MERKIGEIFEFGGEWYQCVEQPEKYDKTVCNLCDFHGIGNCELDRCSGTYRSDKKSVIFKKLEKVGEPYMTGNKLIQRYKIYPTTCCINVYGWYYQNLDVKSWTIDIEIKQSKEDMEENKLNLKPFDLQKAKEGNPVCTRDGRKARIICFDANIMPGNKNILALIRKDDGSEYVEYYTSNGKFSDSKDDINDLMMLPEKKEGWVNVYKGSVCISVYPRIYKSREEAVSDNTAVNRIDTVTISWEE